MKEIVRLVENNRFLKLIVLLLAANNFEPIEGETKLKLLVSLVVKTLKEVDSRDTPVYF